MTIPDWPTTACVHKLVHQADQSSPGMTVWRYPIHLSETIIPKFRNTLLTLKALNLHTQDFTTLEKVGKYFEDHGCSMMKYYPGTVAYCSLLFKLENWIEVSFRLYHGLGQGGKYCHFRFGRQSGPKRHHDIREAIGNDHEPDNGIRSYHGIG